MFPTRPFLKIGEIMADKSKSSASGTGVLGLLGVLFVGLKLTGYIDWAWWWVTLPFWWWVPVLTTGAITAVFWWLIAKGMK